MAAENTYSADRIDDLLRCPICLDRFNEPKILPCQHTFCHSPCLQQLCDVSTRMIKCPECRKDHTVPYGGPSCFPNNFTILNFLDIAAARAQTESTTGTSGNNTTTNAESQQVPTNQQVPTSQHAASEQPSTNRKCAVCESENDLSKCLHCDKMTCNSCKQSHMSQLKFDIGRLVNQLRRNLPTMSNGITDTERKEQALKNHAEQIKSQIHGMVERHIRSLKERENMLGTELEVYLQGEQRKLRLHQENVEVEVASIASYCDSTEAILNNTDNEISDGELINMKRYCGEYASQVRNAENISIPETRDIRLEVGDQSHLHSSISNMGDLITAMPSTNALPTGTHMTSVPQDSQHREAAPIGSHYTGRLMSRDEPMSRYDRGRSMLEESNTGFYSTETPTRSMSIPSPRHAPYMHYMGEFDRRDREISRFADLMERSSNFSAPYNTHSNPSAILGSNPFHAAFQAPFRGPTPRYDDDRPIRVPPPVGFMPAPQGPRPPVRSSVAFDVNLDGEHQESSQRGRLPRRLQSRRHNDGNGQNDQTSNDISTTANGVATTADTGTGTTSGSSTSSTNGTPYASDDPLQSMQRRGTFVMPEDNGNGGVNRPTVSPAPVRTREATFVRTPAITDSAEGMRPLCAYEYKRLPIKTVGK